MWSPVARYPWCLGLSRPVHIHTPSSCPPMDTEVTSIAWLFYGTPQGAQGCRDLSKLVCSSDKEPEVGLLDHTGILVLIFSGPSVLFPRVAAAVCTPPNGARGFLFPASSPAPHIPALLTAVTWYLVVWLCVSLMMSDAEHLSRSTCWPCVCFGKTCIQVLCTFFFFAHLFFLRFYF